VDNQATPPTIPIFFIPFLGFIVRQRQLWSFRKHGADIPIGHGTGCEGKGAVL
jgi:hypothetical protein